MGFEGERQEDMLRTKSDRTEGGSADSGAC